MKANYERKTEPVQVDVNGKLKVEQHLLRKRKIGEGKTTIGKFYSLAAEEKLKRETK